MDKRLCPICGKKAHEHPLVMGGQGRSGKQISDEMFWFVCFMALAMVSVILVACLLRSGGGW